MRSTVPWITDFNSRQRCEVCSIARKFFPPTEILLVSFKDRPCVINSGRGWTEEFLLISENKGQALCFLPITFFFSNLARVYFWAGSWRNINIRTASRGWTVRIQASWVKRSWLMSVHDRLLSESNNSFSTNHSSTDTTQTQLLSYWQP